MERAATDPDDSAMTPGPSRAGTLLRFARNAFVRWLIGICVLAALLWLVASQGLGMRTVVPWALRRALPDGWTVHVADVEGDWTSEMRLRQLSLQGPNVSASLNGLRVEYDLVPLLRRRIRVSRIEVVEPSVEARLPSAEPGASRSPKAASMDTTREPRRSMGALVSTSPFGDWALTIDAVEVSRGRVSATAPTESYHAEHVSLRGGLRWTQAGLEAALDSLTLDLNALPRRSPPSGRDTLAAVSGRLALAAHIDDGVLDVRRLEFTSDHGLLTGGGRIPLAGPKRADEGASISLHGEDLDVRHVPVTLPAALFELPNVAFDAAMQDRPDGTVHGVATVRAGPGHDSLRGGSGSARARMEATLARWSPDGLLRLEGTLVHRPPASAGNDLSGSPLRLTVTASRDPERHTGVVAGLSVDASLARGRGPGTTRWQSFADAHAELGVDSAVWALDVLLDSMSLEGKGAVSWPGGSTEVVAEPLEAAAIDLRALSESWPSTSLTGRVDGRVDISSLDSLRGDVRLSLARSDFAGTEIDSLDVRSHLVPGSLRGRMSLVRDARHLDVSYEATLRDSVLEARADEISVLSVTDTLPGSEPPAASVVTLHGSGTGHWALGSEAARGAATLTFDSATVGAVRLREAVVDGELDGQEVRARLTTEVLDALPVPVSVQASLDTRGFDPSAAEGTVHLRAVPHADGARSPVDSAVATVTALGNGRLTLEGSVKPAGEGRLTVRGHAMTDGAGWDLAGSIEGHVTAPDSVGSFGLDSLLVEGSARWTRSGGWRRASLDVASSNAEWRGVDADRVVARARFDSTVVSLDTLEVSSEVLALAGAGTLRRDGSHPDTISVSGELLDLSPLLAPDDTGSVTLGQSDIRATLSGSLDSLSLASSVTVRALVSGDLRASGVELGLGADLRGPTSEHGPSVRNASLDLGVDRLSIPDGEIRRVDVAAEGGMDTLSLDVSALVDDHRNATLHARVDRSPEGHRATIDRLDLQLDEDRWSLADSARLDYGASGGYALRSLVLEAGNQTIEIDGSVGADRALDVRLEADSVNVTTVADLIGLPGVEGWLGGRAQVDGTLDRPTGWTYLRGALHLPGSPPAPTRISVRSDGARISGDIDLHSEDEGHLTVDGSVRIPGVPAEADSSGRSALDVEIASDGFRLSALQPLIDRDIVRDLDGSLQADLTLGGSPTQPDARGTLRIREGTVRLPALGVTWEGIGLSAKADGAELVLDPLDAESGSGTASVVGTVSLEDPYALDLDARLSEFQAIRTEAYHGTVSGSLSAGGSFGRPDVEGDLSVESVDVYLGGRTASRDLEDVELTEEDMRMLRERFGYVPRETERTRPLADRLSADLTVHLGRDSWLRNRSSPELSVPFTGDMEAHLRPGEGPDLQGQVSTIAGRGFVEQFGRRFELREGTVTFDGPPEATQLDLSATYTIPSREDPNNAEATIVLAVQGTRDSLSLELSSEPPMENSDIVSYIATGRPAAGALSFQESDQNGGLASAGAELALGQLTGVIESAAGQSVGLDVVEIRREGFREATLVAGKYISPRVYVGFAQPVMLREGDGLSLGDEGESEVEVEIEALRWLLLNVEGSSSALRLFLKGRYAY